MTARRSCNAYPQFKITSAWTAAIGLLQTRRAAIVWVRAACFVCEKCVSSVLRRNNRLVSAWLTGFREVCQLSFGRSVETSKNKKTRLMLLLATIQTDATIPKNEGGKKKLTVQWGVWSPFVAKDLFFFAESSNSVWLSAGLLVILSPVLWTLPWLHSLMCGLKKCSAN